MHEHRTVGRVALTFLLVLSTTALGAVAVAAAVAPALGEGAAEAGTFPMLQGATQSSPGDAEPEPEVMELGVEVYRSQCQSCHGRTGEGDGPAARFVDPQPRDLSAGDWMYAEAGTVEAIAGIVSSGIDDTAMEPFEELLTEEEIRAVATYVVHEIVSGESESR